MPRRSPEIREGFKRCASGDQCLTPDGPWLPATTDYFHRSKAHQYGLSPRCKRCAIAKALESQRRRYAAVLARRKAYYWADPDKARKATRDYTDAHREEVNAHRKERRAANPEPKRATDRAYGQRNRDKIRARQRVWERENPDKKKAIGARYRARKNGLPFQYSDDDWQLCLTYWGGRCAFCGALPNGRALDAEHWIPVNHEGDNPGTVPENILPACRKCNSSKHDRDAREWLEWRLGKEEAAEKLRQIDAYFRWIAEYE